jgi:hypothetical protein
MCFNNFLRRAGALAFVVAFVTACGGGGSTVTPAGVPTLNNRPSPPSPPNALAVTVDTGPANSGYNVNRLYTTVTICFPGSLTQCQTIDHVLVDTGSTGLRLLASKMASALHLSNVTGSATSPLLNCVQFVDGTVAWGPIVTADVVVAGKTAASAPIQVVGDPAFNSLTLASPSPCGGTAMTTSTDLGANGVLGIGLFKTDCGTDCETNPGNGSYFTCTNTNCTATNGTTAILTKQLTNPVSLFAADNNGVQIELPVVSSATASSLQGSLIFGINTQANNQLASTTKVLAADSFGYITTSLTLPGSQLLSLSNSFIDSGSNGFYFDTNSSVPPTCAGTSASFYCPASPTPLSATMLGANGVRTAPIAFSIGNASAMFSDSTQAVLPNLAGPSGTSAIATSFDWGLPFFYGRRVFFGIEGMTPSGMSTSGPFFAF